MSAASMLTALMIGTVMFVMITFGMRIVVEFARKIGRYRSIGIPLHAAKMLDAGRRQRILCSCTNAAADQNVNTVIDQQTGQGAMSGAAYVQNLRFGHLTVNRFINLKTLRMSEMLKNHAILIGYCNFHGQLSLQ